MQTFVYGVILGLKGPATVDVEGHLGTPSAYTGQSDFVADVSILPTNIADRLLLCHGDAAVQD